jgi:hypothetical protein
MEDARTIPSASSPADTEKFWTDGTQAYPADNFQQEAECDEAIAAQCCPGIDLPGLGREHCSDCPNGGRPRIDLENVLKLEHDLQIAQLIFAARKVAERNLRPHFPSNLMVCYECAGTGRDCKSVKHSNGCWTGRVLSVIDALLDTDEDSAALDGAQPRGLNQRVCLRCGQSGGLWGAEPWAVPQDLSLLGLNQVIGPGAVEGEKIIFTHCCAPLIRLFEPEGGAL